MSGNVRLASYAQATGHFESGDFADAQHAVSACLQEVYANIHRFAQTENLQNIYGTKVSVIVVSHRSGLEACEVGRGIEDFIRRPDVELIFVGNGLGAAEGASGPCADTARVFGLPENIGCSAARNVGAYVARGECLLFLDDDASTGAADLELLAGTLIERGAVAVRGRIVPKSGTGLTGNHYDLGDSLKPAPPTTEGFSAWRASAFEKYGGFDPLLAGHEGMDLCSRMLGDMDAKQFLYQPGAVMRHDYAGDDRQRLEKVEKLQLSDRYLAFKGIDKDLVASAFREVEKAHAV
ncbi:GT2 family glycosyltransferase [Labrenzia sp. MBR-25]